MFFRASRDYIVNLSQVKQSRLSKDTGLIFLLNDGKEVVFSRRQSVLFRKTRGL
jgi:DNA-binding LytR/AlgR family response regulator